MLAEMPPVQNNHIETYPMTDGISAQLVPQKNENMTFPRTVFSFGIFNEKVLNSTANSYRASGYGFSLGMQHHIRGFWSGGIDLRWSDWLGNNSAQNQSSTNQDTSPLSIFSKIEGTPRLDYLLGNDLGNMFRPYFAGGIGYTIFFDDRSWFAARAKSAFGEISATYGVGFRVTFPKSIALKFSFERWRGIQSSEYHAQMYRMELVFGDVDNI
ncbi:outer membrane beta-barrel protein [Fluviispira multicolorata]|uniref:Outer membrane beta-barrel protein n=1 Tax=Fluviispira multicolorata TaxID=2654512 RepID=A0A833JF54_9BACT|nr:outer membrane beta-barrel protein [Fluviispira multicolorata]KAB8030794.1 outer membrane beta-barrel protein [Fluviispira multicolorata]